MNSRIRFLLQVNNYYGTKRMSRMFGEIKISRLTVCNKMKLINNFRLLNPSCRNSITWRWINDVYFRRNYTTNKKRYICWNCNQIDVEGMFCEQCGSLQSISTGVNYFKLFDLPEDFDLKRDKLTKKFRTIQTLIHPDKFHNKTSKEQKHSSDWSSYINRAYRTLYHPLKRGQYLLNLRGKAVEKQNSANNDWLMYMMERNEQVETASTESRLKSLHDEVSKEIEKKVAELKSKFHINDLESAQNILIELKYLESIEKSIEKKFESIRQI